MNSADKLLKVLIECNRNADRILEDLEKDAKLRDQHLQANKLSPKELMLLYGRIEEGPSDSTEKSDKPNI